MLPSYDTFAFDTSGLTSFSSVRACVVGVVAEDVGQARRSVGLNQAKIRERRSANHLPLNRGTSDEQRNRAASQSTPSEGFRRSVEAPPDRAELLLLSAITSPWPREDSRRTE